MRRTLQIPVLLIFLLAMTGCQIAPSAEGPTPTPAPTEAKPTYIVQRGDIIQQTVIYGKIQPVKTVELAFKADGKVRTAYALVNEKVTTGQLLADLDVINDLQKQLHDTQAASDAAATESKNKLRRVEIALQIAQLNLDQAKSQGASQDVIKINELQVELAQMDYDEVNAAVVIATSNDKAAQLQQQIEDARLYATMDGQLLSTVNAGRLVRAGATMAVIGDPSNLEVVAQASNDQLKAMTEGMAVTVTLDQQNNKALSGKIRQLPYPYGSGGADGIDATVRIVLDESPTQGGYKLTEPATVTIVLAHKTGVLWVPVEAVRTVAGRSFTILQDPNGKQQHVNLTIGIIAQDRAEIIEGLKEGQVVVGP